MHTLIKGPAAAGLAAIVALAALGMTRISVAGAHPPRPHVVMAQHCADPYPPQRDPSNPLDLPTPPGSDPLTGASFFIPGPAHGSAASAIAQLVGLNPKGLAAGESWASFQLDLSSGPLSQRLAANPSLAGQVQELSKIASEPEAQRFSIFSEGGGPGAIFGQVQKIFCTNITADPGSIQISNR
jgi:hypothetical protein